MKITDLLSNTGYILYNKAVAHEYGIKEAILLGELCAEHNYWESIDQLEDGWFYSTIENVEQATALSAHQQRSAIQSLVDEGFLSVQQRGVPCKRFFKLDVKKLNNQLLKNLTTRSEKTSQLDVKKLNGNNNKNSNKNNNKKIYIGRGAEKPSVDDIQAYIDEKNLNVDAEFFYTYFEEGGWMDSTGKPVKNWKQKLLTWDRENKSKREEKEWRDPKCSFPKDDRYPL